MKQVKVIATLKGFEGEDYGSSEVTNHAVTVKSHWNRESQVHLRLGDVEVVVVAEDLIEAVRRCSK